MTDRALRDFDEIYAYIAKILIEPNIALNLIGEIESGILSLDTMPHRCSERKVGAYAKRGYRQLFVKNYTVLFRIDEGKKNVIVVTIIYSARQF
jgi:plasmid stabilization system protein ParE